MDLLAFYCSIVSKRWRTMKRQWKKLLTLHSYFKYLHLCSVLTIKSSFCEHRSPKNGHNFKSWYDTTKKFSRNASDMWIWKVKKCVNKNFFNSSLLTISPPTSCKVSEKTNERSTRYLQTHGRTNTQTDGQGRLLRTPSAKPGVQKWQIFEIYPQISHFYP